MVITYLELGIVTETTMEDLIEQIIDPQFETEDDLVAYLAELDMALAAVSNNTLAQARAAGLILNYYGPEVL